ncbi:type III secretion system export apparatus subunit SctS [Carnimonas bestiolae]|uniref:type III secretion system export apparatus subunit SctS n=1 Tax=Carnimonas bestiolae TaxID=3402172 RepID=UPI003EDBB03B
MDDVYLSTLHNALWLVLLLSAPPLIVAILVGASVGLLQAVTQIQDQTLPQGIKLAAVMLVLILFGTLFGGQVVQLANHILDHFAEWTR